MDLDSLIQEVETYLASIDVNVEGEHLWSNHQDIIAITLRLQEIHNQIAIEEIKGTASAELKKFRTLVIDPTVDRLDKLATFESRKLTGKKTEWEMERE